MSETRPAHAPSRARAPGKLVLSGAYSVLYGAPAIVTAVSRSALADASRTALHVADEVLAAVRLGFVPAPCFVDASELRTSDGASGTRKLGLGSSAAILIATIAAFRGAPSSEDERRALFLDGLSAHREAQGGGSGVDVAASTFGGTLRFLRGADGAPPAVERLALPDELRVVIYAARANAVTASFVARVRAVERDAAELFSPLMRNARAGAEAAAEATTARALTDALDRQRDALGRIGELAGVPIVTAETHELAAVAASEHAFFGPSGAGGGDVAFFASDAPPSALFDARASALGYDRLDADIGAPGVRDA